MEDLDVELCREVFPDVFAGYDDPEEDMDEILEKIYDLLLEEGKCVYELDWGGGYESVYLYRDRYFADSTECGMAGPFDNFREAFDCYQSLDEDGLIPVNTMTQSITCSAWKDDKLICMLNLDEEDLNDTIIINGRKFYMEVLKEEQKRMREFM